MKRKLILLGLIIVLLSQGLCLNAQEKGRYIINGNKYLQEMPESVRGTCIAGLMDMWLYLYPQDIDDKANEIIIGQLKAISEKYLQENPEQLRQSAASLFVAAMYDALLKLGSKSK